MLARVKQELLMRLPQLPTHGCSFDELRPRPDNGNYLHLTQICIAWPAGMTVQSNFPGNPDTQTSSVSENRGSA